MNSKKDTDYLRTTGPHKPLWIALDGATIAGCVYMHRLPGNTGEVKRLFVRDEYRGLGLRRQLMETPISDVTHEGCSVLRLDTTPFMENAANLYHQLGFETYTGHESLSAIPTPNLNEITGMRLELHNTRRGTTHQRSPSIRNQSFTG